MNESMYKLMAVVFLCTTIAVGTLAVNYYYKLGVLEGDYHKVLEELEDFTVQVNIMIDYSDGNIEWFNDTRIQVGANLFEATGLACDIKYQTSDFGSFITSINGIEQDTTHFWIWSFYDVKWEMGPVGAAQHILHNGDVVRWTYTSFE
jgi:hypothetical protein